MSEHISLQHVLVGGPLVGVAEHLLTLAPRTLLDYRQMHIPINSSNRQYFKGGVAMMSGVSFGHIGLFGCLYQSQGEEHVGKQMLYGGLGRFLHDACIVPGDTIRMNMNIHNLSMKEACHFIMSQKGTKGFFAGLIPSLLYSVPCGAIEFAVLQQCVSCNPFIAGCLAGLVSNILLSPIDTIRTHVQTVQTAQACPGGTSLATTICQLYQHRGWSAFYQGLPLRVCSVMLSYGLFKWICTKANIQDLD